VAAVQLGQPRRAGGHLDAADLLEAAEAAQLLDGVARQ
jgi:hypothetical protein